MSKTIAGGATKSSSPTAPCRHLSLMDPTPTPPLAGVWDEIHLPLVCFESFSKSARGSCFFCLFENIGVFGHFSK